MSYEDLFIGIEKQKRQELKQLFGEWRKSLIGKPKIKPPIIKTGEYTPNELFTDDGFYPGYFSAETKVLFIAREGRYPLPQENTRDRIIYDLEVFDKCPSKIYDDDPFWQKLIHLVWGIKRKGGKPYSDLPQIPTNGKSKINDALIVKEIFNDMKNKEFSFAFMNLSKYINPVEPLSRSSNYPLINLFLNHSDLGFVKKEIAILEPHYIVTLNLSDGQIKKTYLNQIFIQDKNSKNDCNNGVASLENYIFDGNSIPRIDIFHFSAKKIGPKGNKRDLDEELDFYNPVMNLLFNKNYPVLNYPD